MGYLLRRAVELAPADAQLRVALGLSHERRRELGLAAAQHRKASQLAPEAPEPYLELGRVASRRGEPQDALRLYAQAAKASPRYPLAPYNSGVVRQELGQFEAAIADFRRALELTPRGSAMADAALRSIVQCHALKGDMIRAWETVAEWKSAGGVPDGPLLDWLGRGAAAPGRRP